MELNDKVTQLEDEIKILKNEIQAVLLDLRESYLNNKNPFNTSEPANFGQIPPVIPSPQIQVVPAAPLESEKEVVVRQLNDKVQPVEESCAEPVPDVDDKSDWPGENADDTPAGMRSENGFERAAKDIEAPRRPLERSSLAAPKEWRCKPGLTNSSNDIFNNNDRLGTISISVISKLTNWVESSSSRLGADRALKMLDVAEMIGYIESELKIVLSKLVAALPAAEPISSDSKDYLAAWLSLAEILGKGNKPEVALLYMLCQEAENR
jgi:hypothetical protein